MKQINPNNNKQYEVYWSPAFNEMSDFVFLLDNESTIINVNDTFVRASKKSRTDIVGKKCYEVIHGKGKPIEGCCHRKMMERGANASCEIFEENLGKWIQVSVTPILGDKSEVIGAIHTARDISVQREEAEALKAAHNEMEIQSWGLKKTNEGIRVLYKELEQKNLKLREFDKLKDDFVSMVSHEFKNPLFIIREYLDIILNESGKKIPPKKKQMLTYSKKNVERLLRLVTDLLDLSKIEAGKMDLKMEKVDVEELIREIVPFCKQEAEKKHIKIKDETDKTISPIWGDRDKIHQVIVNLLSNAIKFTPEEGVVTIRLKDTGASIKVEIEDTGLGIEETDSRKIFDKFERITAEKHEGTGLGLPITKEIVQLHNGDIWVESEIGKGSTFIFTLPKEHAGRKE